MWLFSTKHSRNVQSSLQKYYSNLWGVLKLSEWFHFLAQSYTNFWLDTYMKIGNPCNWPTNLGSSHSDSSFCVSGGKQFISLIDKILTTTTSQYKTQWSALLADIQIQIVSSTTIIEKIELDKLTSWSNSHMIHTSFLTDILKQIPKQLIFRTMWLH